MDPEELDRIRRNSGLALTKEGVWTWGDNVVANPRVQALFHRGVTVRPDGEVTLSVGRMWAYVKTAGPAFFVRAIAPGSEPIARLLGDRELPLCAGGGLAAGWGPDDRLYLWIDGLAGPAICLRDAHQALSARLMEGPSRIALDLGDPGSGAGTGDRRIAVVPLPAIPLAAAPRPS